MRRYLESMLIGSLTIVMLVATLNWLVDPYWIWKSPTIKDFNEFKPAVRDNIRIFKLGARRVRPVIVILGTSRSDTGLDPQHPAFGGRQGFNLSAPAQPYEESLDLFKWATEDLGSKSVVLTLDFFAANAYAKMPADYKGGDFGLSRELRLLLSLDTLVESGRTITTQRFERERSSQPSKFNSYREDGLRVVGSEKAREWGGHHNGFMAVEKAMLRDIYLPPPKCKFQFTALREGRAPMTALQNLIAEAHRKDIDLKLAISPIHARLLEAISAIGLWEKWEDWKLKIVEMNEIEALKSGHPAFTLWDFSGYSAITTEPVPIASDAETRMRWYWESSHYKKETGDLMLDVMFERPSKLRIENDDFGIPLTQNTLQGQNKKIRAARELFRKKFPADIAEIENASHEATLQRQLQGCTISG